MIDKGDEILCDLGLLRMTEVGGRSWIPAFAGMTEEREINSYVAGLFRVTEVELSFDGLRMSGVWWRLDSRFRGNDRTSN